MQIKVLYIVPPSTSFAGMERVVHDIASSLATDFRDRISVTVLYCYRYPELPKDLPYRVIWEDVQQLRSFPFRVSRWLRREPYDIVVSAQFEPTALLWLFHRLRAGKARFVMHFHGNPKVESSASHRARFAFAFFNAALRRMDKVLAVSPSLAHYIDQRTGRAGMVEYLPNPVRQFSQVTRVAHPGEPVSFVSIGRLALQKGHDILIEAFAKALAKGTNGRLTIVGEGAERTALTAQIERLGLGDRVRLAGNVPDPVRELEDADCFVSASRWEGFGVAIVEGLSAGLTVIATDCEFGPSDLIDSPEKGRIVPAGDVDALAAAMAEFALSSHDEGNERLRREAAAQFSLDRVVAQHAAMLEAVSA
jgi:glycosyltransferase involved in cell wall biosynthesis